MQGRSQQGTTCVSALARLSRPPQGHLTTLQNCSDKFYWYKYEASCSQLSSFKIPEAPNQDPIPRWSSMERAETPDQEQMVPFEDHGAHNAQYEKFSSTTPDALPCWCAELVTSLRRVLAHECAKLVHKKLSWIYWVCLRKIFCWPLLGYGLEHSLFIH